MFEGLGNRYNVTPSESGRRTSIYQASPSLIQDLPKASSERFRVFVRKLRTQVFFHVQRCSVLTCLTFLKQSLTEENTAGIGLDSPTERIPEAFGYLRAEENPQSTEHEVDILVHIDCADNVRTM